MLITVPEVMAQTLGTFLAAETSGRFGASRAELTELLPFAAKLTLECIGNSDALYHNIEHSMLVTLVGHDILIGRHLQRPTTASDYANFILACLTHDIGYVRGVVQGDAAGHFVADVNGRTVQLPLGASDAALAPYHVDRSKLFVIERLDSVELLDAPRIARAIEYTRFPYAPSPSNGDDLNEEEGLLLRAADLIGQLGDPNYMRKSNALFYEFEETGLNKTLGYNTPADIVYKYPQFYWTNVAPQIQTAIRYLNVTSRASMDRQSLQQCLSGGATAHAIGSADPNACERRNLNARFQQRGRLAWSWRSPAVFDRNHVGHGVSGCSADLTRFSGSAAP
jgi:hypothetical protein